MPPITQRAAEALRNPAISGMLDAILKAEGGYNEVKGDKGGATNLGVSLRYAKGIGLDLDGDGDTDAADILLVTPAIARQLYASDFYDEPKLWMLPEGIRHFMFDFAVNSGPGRAVIEMQEKLNLLRRPGSNSWPFLIADGRIGKQSAAAATEAWEEYGVRLVNHLCDARQSWVEAIVRRDPEQGKFLKGWTNRINKFRVAEPLPGTLFIDRLFPKL